MSQDVNANYVGLKVVAVGTATVATTVTAITAPGTLTTAAAACPAGYSTSVGNLGVGQPGAGAPKPGNTMAQLGAILNLSPSLVSTSDDCSKNQYEGFGVIGGWANPLIATGTLLGYAAGAHPTVSVGQILFPTAVVSFNGYIRPFRTGGQVVVPAGSHYEFEFPSLPTSLAECLTGANPSNPTGLSFGLAATVLTGTPALPTGSGNPGDPTVRALGPQVGANNGRWQLITNPATIVASGALPTCTIPVPTADPSFVCGDS
jgi:hypothetical protein